MRLLMHYMFATATKQNLLGFGNVPFFLKKKELSDKNLIKLTTTLIVE